MNPKTLKIFISSEGGQGGQLLASIFVKAASMSGFNVSLLPHYGVEKRGGISLAYLVVSNGVISNPRFTKADIVVVTTWRQIEIPKQFIDKHTIIINGYHLLNILNYHKIVGKSLNMLILAILIKIAKTLDFTISQKLIEKIITDKFSNSASVLGQNMSAFNLSNEIGKNDYSQPLDTIKKPKLNQIILKDGQKQFTRFPQMCKGCGLCIEKCPAGALGWSIEKGFLNKPIPEVDMQKCIACKTCENICPDCAIKIIKN